MIGTRLGPYELRAELGQGGMATVYRAYQPAVDREVALKVIHAASLHDPAVRDRFRREARLIARLEHPHILPIYDFDGHSIPPYLVMRYLEPGTLRDRLIAGGIPLAEAARLVSQIASALDYAHQQGIVHRDIKPSNILLDRHGNALVSDFGIARTIAAQSEAPITSSGTIVGTPDYMAPEQVQCRLEVDGRADIYALGVLVFQLLTGQLPYQADQPMGVLLLHLSAPIPSPRALNPALPPAADELMRSALAKEPEARFASAGELALAFTALTRGLTGAPAHLRPAQARSTIVLEQHEAPASAPPPKSLAPTPTPSEQQRLVTALYANVEDYLEFVEAQLGAERALAGVRVLGERAQAIIADHGGKIVSWGQSDFLALWGADSTAENDPERAVWAALALRERLAAAGSQLQITGADPLPFRVGVHLGPALITPGEGPAGLRATGATLAVVRRMAEQAEGHILISHEIYRVVRGVFVLEVGPALRLRGRSEPLLTYLVRAAQARAFPTLSRDVEGIETPLVGREAELSQLQRVYQDVIAEGEAQLVTIFGEAGLGKSRLLDAFNHWRELLSNGERSWWLSARASAELTNRPYGLLRELLLFRFAILDDDPLPTVRRKLEAGIAQMLGAQDDELAQLIGQLAGFDLGDTPHVRGFLGDSSQLAARARRLFGQFIARLCAMRAVVCQLEDLHLADRESLALLADLLRGQPPPRLLIIATARPALRERYPAWGAGVVAQTMIALRPLDRSAGRELARALLVRVADPPKALRELLVERSGGNPLFMEELLRVLLDDRVIVKERATVWRVVEGRLGSVRVPATLAGLLQARLDTLLAPERLALQRAAVMGRTFLASAVEALGVADEQQLLDLPATLEQLVARDFIERRPASAGGQEYAFRESLLRELLYGSLLDRQRQAYHRALADWLALGERAGEYLPLIAEHYELGALPTEAEAALTQAGDQALARSAFATAERFYTRALALTLQPSCGLIEAAALHGEEAIGRLHLRRAEVRYRQGDFAAAQADLDTALTTSIRSLRAAALALQGELLGRSGDEAAALAALEAALPLARDAAEPETLARALSGLGEMRLRQGRLQEARGYLEESLALARLHNHRPRLLSAQNQLATVAFHFGDLAQAEELLQAVCTQAMAVGNREWTMTALNSLGEVAAERDDLPGAQYLFREAVGIAREIGAEDSMAVYLLNLAAIEIRLGQLREARALLTEGLSIATELGALPGVVQGIITHGLMAAAQSNHWHALGLWGLARNHPACTEYLRRAVTRYSAALQLDAATLAAGLAQGETLDVEITLAELLA